MIAVLAALVALPVLAEEGGGPSPCGSDEVQRLLLGIARQTVAAAVSGEALPALPEKLPECVRRRRGTFVTLEVGGELRGCRGSLQPLTRNLAAEVRRMAQAAARRDRRYAPLPAKELDRLDLTVTVVERLEPLSEVEALGGPRYGLVARSGSKVGVVLPYEGKDPRTRLRWALTKAGIRSGEAYTLSRLVGERFCSRARGASSRGKDEGR